MALPLEQWMFQSFAIFVLSMGMTGLGVFLIASRPVGPAGWVFAFAMIALGINFSAEWLMELDRYAASESLLWTRALAAPIVWLLMVSFTIALLWPEIWRKPSVHLALIGTGLAWVLAIWLWPSLFWSLSTTPEGAIVATRQEVLWGLSDTNLVYAFTVLFVVKRMLATNDPATRRCLALVAAGFGMIAFRNIPDPLWALGSLIFTGPLDHKVWEFYTHIFVGMPLNVATVVLLWRARKVRDPESSTFARTLLGVFVAVYIVTVVKSWVSFIPPIAHLDVAVDHFIYGLHILAMPILVTLGLAHTPALRGRSVEVPLRGAASGIFLLILTTLGRFTTLAMDEGAGLVLGGLVGSTALVISKPVDNLVKRLAPPDIDKQLEEYREAVRLAAVDGEINWHEEVYLDRLARDLKIDADKAQRLRSEALERYRAGRKNKHQHP